MGEDGLKRGRGALNYSPGKPIKKLVQAPGKNCPLLNTKKVK